METVSQSPSNYSETRDPNPDMTKEPSNNTNDETTNNGQENRADNENESQHDEVAGSDAKKSERRQEYEDSEQHRDDYERPRHHESREYRSSSDAMNGPPRGDEFPPGFDPDKFRAKAKPSTCVGVFGFGNLSPHFVEDRLREYGELERFQLITNTTTGTPKGFGFAYFKNIEDAKKLVQDHDGRGMMIDTIRVRLDYSKTDGKSPRHDFRPRGGGRFRGRDDDRYASRRFSGPYSRGSIQRGGSRSFRDSRFRRDRSRERTRSRYGDDARGGRESRQFGGERHRYERDRFRESSVGYQRRDGDPGYYDQVSVPPPPAYGSHRSVGYQSVERGGERYAPPRDDVREQRGRVSGGGRYEYGESNGRMDAMDAGREPEDIHRMGREERYAGRGMDRYPEESGYSSRNARSAERSDRAWEAPRGQVDRMRSRSRGGSAGRHPRDDAAEPTLPRSQIQAPPPLAGLPAATATASRHDDKGYRERPRSPAYEGEYGRQGYNRY